MKSNILNRLLEGKNLTTEQSRATFLSIFKGSFPENKTKAILLLLANKGETAEELLGCIFALEKLEPKKKIKIENVLDTCGTGGDGSHSVNVSTLAAFVIAGAGGRVAKHGNRSITSKCGSSDLMEALGVNLDTKAGAMISAISKCGLGYFHAPNHHPIFSRVQPLRKRLKVKTIFNLLGPMVNPVQIKRQVVGTGSLEVATMYAKILKMRKFKKAWICSGRDGLDEISISKPTDIFEIQSGRIKRRIISPSSANFKKRSLKSIRGDGAKKNKEIALRFLKNNVHGAIREIILMNAAAGLVVAGRAKSFKEGIQLGDEAIISGAAYNVLLKLKKISNRVSK